jgi:hypothetical protein
MARRGRNAIIGRRAVAEILKPATGGEKQRSPAKAAKRNELAA